MHSSAQVSGLSFGNTGDQVGGPSESQCGRKATDDCDDLSFHPERLQGFINRSLVETPPRDADVPASRITGRSDLALAQRVPHSHDANETIPEQRLCTNLRTSRLPHHASLQIDGPVAKRCALFVWFLHEAEPHARSLLADSSNEIWSEVLNKAFAGTKRERPDELFEVELLSRTENHLCVLNELTDPLAEFERTGCGNETSSGSDQKWIACRLSQSRKRAAHRRRAKPQPLGCARNTPFREHCIKSDKQVEIRGRRELILAQFVLDMASNALIKCKWCVFRHLKREGMFGIDPFESCQKRGVHFEANDYKTR
jgi:hypothetical protein